MQRCARRAREHKLSYLALMDEENKDLRLHDIEKMKKEIKAKRCTLDQDKAVITNLVSLLEDEDEYFKCKEEVIDMEFLKNEKNEHVKKDLGLV